VAARAPTARQHRGEVGFRAADGPARIEIRGLAEHGSAALHARRRSAAGWAWTSAVPVPASAAGVVRLDGVDGMRVLWGMRPLGPPFVPFTPAV
jgi:hypothetical protein